MRLRHYALLPIGFTLFQLTGCAPAQHDAKEKFYLIATNTKIPYWQTAKSGFFKAAAQLGVKAEMAGPEVYDAKAEAQEFERIAKLAPTGILVSAADASLLKSAIDSAIAAGVPVITMDSDAPGSKRLLFVGTNNYDAGILGGRLLAKQLNGRGKVVIFTNAGQPNLDERIHGYRDAVAGKSIQFEIVDIKGNAGVAFDLASDIVTKRKGDVDGFVCVEALAGGEVAEVLDRNHITGKPIIAMDTSDNILTGVQKGTIIGTIAQKPYTMGFYGLSMLDNVHHHMPKSLDADFGRDPFSVLPVFVDTGATLIDKSNVDEFQKAQASNKTE